MPLTFTILGIPSGPIVRNSGLWKPDGRKGECGSPIYPRANIDKLIKTVEDFDKLSNGKRKKRQESSSAYLPTYYGKAYLQFFVKEIFCITNSKSLLQLVDTIHL